MVASKDRLIKPKRPTRKKVYKYISFSSPYWTVPFKEKYIHFGKVDNLNDPYEAAFTFSKLKDEKDILKFLKGYEPKFYELYKTGNRTKKQKILSLIDPEFIEESQRRFMQQTTGVACFSKSPNILLMWSHYASIHSGFCIEYDTEILAKQETNSDHINWVNVKYNQDPPVFSLVKPPLFSDYISHKHIAWQYEQEVRAWRLSTPYYYKPECITKVFLGANYSRSIDNLIKLIRIIKRDFPHLLNNTFVSTLAAKKYQVVNKRVDPTRLYSFYTGLKRDISKDPRLKRRKK